MTNYKVVESNDDGFGKVVQVVAEVEGAEGPTEVERFYTWREHERYKVSASGRTIPKTGLDYKAEIEAALDGEFSPKESSPSQ